MITRTYYIVEVKFDGFIHYRIEQEFSYKTMFTRKEKTYRSEPSYYGLCTRFESLDKAKTAIEDYKQLLITRKDNYRKDVEKVSFTV